MEGFAAPPEIVAAFKETEEEFELWPIHVAIVEFFLCIQSQWRRHPMSGLPLGLDYAGVEAASRWQGVAMTPEFFADLRVMEFAFIDETMRRAK